MNYYSDGLYAVEGIQCRGVVHTIRRGDTLYKISRLYGVTVEQLMDSNEDVNVYNLQIGEKLCVPVSERPPRPGMNQGVPYTVRQGDNLNNLLRKFKIDFNTFERLNPQLMPIPLQVNSTVFLPPEKSVDVDNNSLDAYN